MYQQNTNYMSKTKLQIKSIFGNLLFEHETEDNTMAKTVVAAVKSSADLRSADLRSANLRYADLSSADLRSANLSSANLSSADLRYADLRSANLSSANLSSADLRSADLRSANLRYADLSSADLRSANLSSADLSSADLRYAKNSELAIAMTRICAEGNIIGYKKAYSFNGAEKVIIELLIPAEAKRNNAFGRKCRCEYAMVTEINEISTGKSVEKARSTHDLNFIYEIGATVKPEKPYDENFQDECSSGIHFFITRAEAENY